MKAVVTGGAGFIGSHLTDALLRRGDEVLVLDDFSTGREQNLQEAQQEFGAALTVERTDICSPAALNALVSYSPEAVFHLAAQMNVRRSVAEPQFDAEKNIVGTVNLLEASRQCGVRRFLLASTGGAIYGEQEYFPADEKHRIRPECPYGVSKRAGELYLEYYSHAYGVIGGAALRFANVYGPRQNAKGEAGVVAIFAEKILQGEPLGVNGDGEQTRDFIFVTDVVDAVIVASGKTQPGVFTILNVGTAIETSVNGLTNGMRDAWRSISGGKPFPPVEFRPALPGEQRRSVVDIAAIGKTLSWKPKVELATGLARTIESFRVR